MTPRHYILAFVLILAGLAGPGRALPRDEEVRIAAPGASLAGTLSIPEGESEGGARRPGVILLHGSGSMDRTFPVYREQVLRFVELGLVVLDFDRRGIGGSEGEIRDGLDIRLMARDAHAAIAFLRARPEVDPARVGLWGASRGGWIGQVVAREDPNLAFAILVSAPGVSPLDQNLYQRGIDLLESGWSARDVAAVEPLRRELWNYYRTGEGREALETNWARARGQGAWFERLGWPEAPPDRTALNDEQRVFFGIHCAYDPSTELEALRVPTLFLFGAKDRHIPVEASVAATRKAIARGGRAEVEILVFPQAGHLLQSVDGEGECLRCIREAHERGEHPNLDPIDEANEAVRRWVTSRA